MTSAMPPTDGRLLDGRYRLGALLGSGGVADVFMAFDERLHREVAVKMFRGNVGDQLSRHEDEMRTLARLDHPALVTVLDAGEDDETRQPYLVMTLIEGPTLARELELGPLPVDQVADIGGMLSGALAYVHAQGLVHRDIKPANVLMSPDGRVHLTDFGIARLVAASHVTRTGDVLGTPAYFAPEQVTGEPVGPPADVYALGLVLLECLTGRREYDGTPMEAALARTNRQPNVPPSLPAAWRDLLVGMTARSPSARLTAEQVSDRLARMAGGVSDATMAMPLVPAVDPTVAMPMATQVMPPVAPTGATAVPPPPRDSNRRAAWLIALVVLLVIAAAVAAVLLVNRNNNSTGASSGCASGVPAVSGVVGSDLSKLTKEVCSTSIARSASDKLSPYLSQIGQAADARDLSDLRTAVNQMKHAVDNETSVLGATRAARIDDTLTALLGHAATRFTPTPTPSNTVSETPSQSPSSSPSTSPSTSPSATPSKTASSSPSTTPSKTATTKPTVTVSSVPTP
jgi:serine/threonine protein kinase